MKAKEAEKRLKAAGWIELPSGKTSHKHFKYPGKPLDRGEWQMTPPTVNAYYDPLKNHMVFPAGILQAPFYSAKATIPVNLGAMGSFP